MRWDFGVFYVGVFLSLECICGKPEIGFWAAGGCRAFAISFSFGKSVPAAEASAEQRRGAQRRYCKPRARHGAWGWHCKHCKPWGGCCKHCKPRRGGSATCRLVIGCTGCILYVVGCDWVFLGAGVIF